MNFKSCCIVVIGCLVTSFAFSGVESEKIKIPPASKNINGLDHLVVVEQQALARLIEHEQVMLAAKKEQSRSIMITLVWQRFGSMKSCIKALYHLLKPIIDNHQTHICAGGHHRLMHFIELYERLLEIHKTSVLIDSNRYQLINALEKEVLAATSCYDQALEASEFNLSQCELESDEAQAFVDLLIKGDVYTAIGANFSCGALINAGFGGGLGIRKTPAGDTNCALMSESTLSIGSPQLACTKIISNKQSLSFSVYDEGEKGSDGMHLGFLCFGATCAQKGASRLHELLICAPLSIFKGVYASFFNVSPKLTDLEQFQHNLGLTRATCCQKLPGYYEELLNSAETIQAVDDLVQEFRIELSGRTNQLSCDQMPLSH